MDPVRLYQKGVKMLSKNKLFMKKVVWAVFFMLPIYFAPISYTYAVEIPESPSAPTYTTNVPVSPTAPEAPAAPSTETEEQNLSEQAAPVEVIAPPAEQVSIDPVLQPGIEEGILGAHNSETGASSENQALLESSGGDSDTTITVDNEGVVTNTVNLDANSGGNTASYNTGSGSVETGDANVVLSIVNFVNALLLGDVRLLFDTVNGDFVGNYVIDPTSGEAYSLTGSRLDIGNSNTGAESINNSTINMGNSTDIEANNSGIVANAINLAANTGGNQSSYNTGAGSVDTGDANISLNLLNLLNSTLLAEDGGLIGVLNIFGDFIGDLVIPDSLFNPGSSNPTLDITVENANTGAGSENNATATIENSMDVDSDNACEISNDLEIAGNSGNNGSSFNTGSGSVSTGDVDTNVEVANAANQTIIGEKIIYIIVNVLGKWTGSNLLSGILANFASAGSVGDAQTIVIQNENTGAGSQNNATLAVENSTDIDIQNEAAIDNDVKIEANTGNNSASYNTGSGNVETGDVNILANIFNLANLSVISDNFVLFVINIFGDWNGDITDKDTGGTEDTDSGGGTTNNGSNDVVITPVVAGSNARLRVANVGAAATVTEIAVEENENGEVLSVNIGTPGSSEEITPDWISKVLGFLNDNLWYLLILLGVMMLILAMLIYRDTKNRDRPLVAS